MNVSCLDQKRSSAASIVLSLWFSLSGLAAVTGNAVVLWLFYKNESLRTISNRFLASLSVADFLVGLVIDPTWIFIRCLLQSREAPILIIVVDMLWIHTTVATTFNVCCVSVDRFIAICFPFRYQAILTKKKCYTAIILVWLISIGLPFSLLLGDSPANIDKIWLSLTGIIFTAPIAITSFCYFWIFKAARRQATVIQRDKDNLQKTSTVRIIKNYKAIKTIGVVLGVFIVSWLPALVLCTVNHHDITVDDLCFDHKLFNVVWPWIEAIAFTSSAINPWIYYFRNVEFRQALRRTFCRSPCCPSKPDTREVGLKSDNNRKLIQETEL